MSETRIPKKKSSLITDSNFLQNDEVKFDRDCTKGIKAEDVSMAWKNLEVTADVKTQHVFRKATHTFKEIIHNANGFLEPSKLVAILGASGSGKSTLMSVLANRHSGDLKVTGDILLNGEKIKLQLMRTISGFVYQDDFFITTLTVLEHLHFAAQLKLDKTITLEYRNKLVNELLKDVGLTKCGHRLIGSSSYGEGKMNLSGGELKRLSVATELLTNPSLLFCDEPTTGLDSFTALKLMTIMKKMTSQKRKTIVCSIHQPSEQIFDLFHQIILLYNGKIAFIGTTEQALTFFQSVGYTYNQEQNPADYLVKSMAIVPGYELESADRALNICKRFEESPYAKYVYDRIEQQSYGKVRNCSSLSGNVERISWFYMLYLLTYRNILGTIRDPSIQTIRILNKAVHYAMLLVPFVVYL